MDLYFETHGAGRPVLFIPGLGADAECFAFQLPDLARDLQLILVDPRGAGRSPAPPGDYTCEEMADDVAGVLERLGVGPALIAGHSMGGAIAQLVALRHPELVSGLVLIGTCARFPAMTAEIVESWRAQQAEGLSRATFARGFLPWILSRRFFENPLVVREALRILVETPWPQSAEAFASQVAACRSFDSTARLRDIRVPTLVVTGGEDLVVPPEESRRLAEGLPRGRYVELEGLAHACMSEGAAVFNPLVRDFARELAALSRATA